MGPKVCVFPINGTRRWFILEHPFEQTGDWVQTYLDTSIWRHVELYQLLFDHGLATLLTPVFGPDLLERGEEYMSMAAQGLAHLATHPDFLNFYEAYAVRVRFYGDYRKFFGPTSYAYLLDLFDQVTQRTMQHDRYRLFLGVCAQDATETIAELAVRYHATYGCVPNKQVLIELYYGEFVEPVDLFIGFDKFCAFDMPLIATGNEDLYFMVSPSPYLTEGQLRDILYDHLYTRRGEEPDYFGMADGDWALLQGFYQLNLGKTMGVGARQTNAGIWCPLPQVELPDSFVRSPL
jgi:tuberculosinol/isotuberculosinol synthase